MLHGCELVEGVEVNAGNAFAEQVLQLAGGVFQADLLHGFRIGVVGFQLNAEFVGNTDSTEIGHAGELLQGSGNQQPGNQRDAHTVSSELVTPAQKEGVVEKELGGDEVRSGVDFSDEEVAVGVLVRIFDVPFRIACGTNAEASALLDGGYQFAGVVVSIFGPPEFC